jgi:hypothetical protein
MEMNLNKKMKRSNVSDAYIGLDRIFNKSIYFNYSTCHDY